MKIKIQERSWYKRRRPVPEPHAVHVGLEGFEYVNNHFCKMHVTYSDQSTTTLTGRVIFNEIKKHWTVDGMSVAVQIEE